jgi:hypothetical protein
MLYLKVSILLSDILVQNDCRNESLQCTGRRKKVVFAASLPDMPVKTLLFFRDRCRYVGRDAALGKYPVNSGSKICE